MPVSRSFNGTTITLTDEERQPCEVWCRVMGYFRPIDSYNIGKKQEFKDRVYFTEDNALRRQLEVA